ncbi:hypothetical protein BDK51DRAFT_27397, partial [Blyttiomyces helicus]
MDGNDHRYDTPPALTALGSWNANQSLVAVGKSPICPHLYSPSAKLPICITAYTNMGAASGFDVSARIAAKPRGEGGEEKKGKISDEEQAKIDTNIANLKMKKAWDTALGPAKSIPMNAFMLWMSGNSVQIFSILITVMMLWNAIKAVMGTAG